MNSDKPHSNREQLEARLTALLLGELPVDETERVSRAIEHDPALAKLHERLKQTVGLVKAASTTPQEAAINGTEPLKLDDKRRQELLARFKTVTPKEFGHKNRNRQVSVLLVGVAAALALLAALTVVLNTESFSSMKRIGIPQSSVYTAMPQQAARLAAETAIQQANEPGIILPRATLSTDGTSAAQPSESPNLQVITAGGASSPVQPYLPSYGMNHSTATLSVEGHEAPGYSKLPADSRVDFLSMAPNGQESTVLHRVPTANPSRQPQLKIADSEPIGVLERPSAAPTPTAPASGSHVSIVLPSPDELSIASKPVAREQPVGLAINGPNAANSSASSAILADSFTKTMIGGTTGRFGGAGGGGGGGAGPSSTAETLALNWDDAKRQKADNGLGDIGGERALRRTEELPRRNGFGLHPEQSASNPAAPMPPPVTRPHADTTPAVDSATGLPVGAGPTIEPTTGLPMPVETPAPSAAGNEKLVAQTMKLESNQTQPEVQVKAKFVEVGQSDSNAVGFNYYLGNGLAHSGRAGKQELANLDTATTRQDLFESKPIPGEANGKESNDPLHQKQGNLGLADGGVSQFSRAKLGESLKNSASVNIQLPAEDVSGYAPGPVALQSGSSGQPTGGPVLAASYNKAKTPESGLRGAIVTNGTFVAGKDWDFPVSSTANTGSLGQVHRGTPWQTETAATVAGKATEAAPSMLMSAQAVRKLEALRIESEAQLMRERTLLEELSKTPREQLAQALPTAAPDTLLSSLIEQKNMAERQLRQVEQDRGPSSPEAAKAKAQAEDLRKKIDSRAEGILVGLNERVKTLSQGVDKLKEETEKAAKEDAGITAQNRPYFEAKRKLEEQQRFGQILEMKIASERIETALPRSSLVEVSDLAKAEPAKQSLGTKLRGLVTGQTERTARVKLERDQSDITFSEVRALNSYDPFFIQTELETIQSDRVLGKVVKDMDLGQAWAKKGDGKPLDDSQALALLKKKIDLRPVKNTSFFEIAAKGESGEEAAKLANAVAKAYTDYRLEQRKELSLGGIAALEQRYSGQQQKIAEAQKEVERLGKELQVVDATAAAGQPPKEVDEPLKPKRAPDAPVPQPEIATAANAFSTFSLNVSDVSFKLAAASLEQGAMPEANSVRTEEFINAFDYRDPEPSAGIPVAFAWERARYPFAQNRDVVRLSLKTAAAGRQPGKPMNVVLLMDNSGSMERADRVTIIHEALKVLAAQLRPEDKFSIVTFSRTPRLAVDGVAGNEATQAAETVSGLTPEGGTNLEEAMKLAYETALRHYLTNGINRVVLLTDGAANLGDVEPESLKQKVEANRKQGIAFDCFGIGWEGYNDDLLEVLSRNGDGRYGFINTPEEAATEFVGQLAGALHVAASDVKVQVEFNPKRVTVYRQLGYAKHQLTKEQFRDNTVDAAELGAAEAGNALYVLEVNPAGAGALGTVRVRYKVPGTADYREQEWALPYNGTAVALDQASSAMKLAASASAFSEWLVASPYAGEVTPDTLLGYLRGVPDVYGADGRPKKLEWMLRQAKSISGH